MSLIGMSKETYEKVLGEVSEIRYLMALAGVLNNCPTVEKILIERHNLTGDEVKTFTKLANTSISFSLEDGLAWIGNRPEPKLEDYPEVAELLPK